MTGSEKQESEPPEPTQPSGRNRRWVLPTSILGSSLGFIDSSVVNVALPKIQDGLSVNFETSQWIANGYTLMLASLILFGGAVGDVLGQRRTFIYGLIGFTVASMACGAAPTGIALVAFRGAQGIAAAFLIPSSLALIGTAYSHEERGRAVGTWAAAAALTTALGPPVGGWLVDAVGWRSVFFVNVPTAIVALMLALRIDRDRPARGAHLDLAGPALAVLCLGSISYGLIVAGTGAVLRGSLFLLLAIPMGVLFVWREMRARDPIIPLRLFLDRQFAVANTMTIVLYAALTGSLFLLPFVLVRSYGYSAGEAGAAFLPFSAIMGAGSRYAGTMAQRVGNRAMLVGGSVVTASGHVVFALQAGQRGFWLGFLPGLILTGVGMTICVAPLTTAVLDAAPDEQSGSASGVNNAAARLGGLLAIAALGFAFGNAPSSALLPEDIVDAYRQTMWAAAMLAAASALIGTIGLPRTPSRRERPVVSGLDS